MKPIVIYPRGFLGYDVGLPIQEPQMSMSKLLGHIRNNNPNIGNTKPTISNTELEQLFHKSYNGYPVFSNMQNREQVLKLVLDAFGTKSFYDWCDIQKESPYFTDLHKNFLNDTFRFIATGERSMSTMSWYRIISPRNANIADKKADYKIREFFNLDKGALMRKSHLVTDIVASWTSQYGGFEDMLASATIFFGQDCTQNNT